MAFDLNSSVAVKEDLTGRPRANPGFDVDSSRSVDTPFYEGFSMKEDVALPFVKGARDIAVSSPQKFADLLVEYGERAEETPDYFDNAVSMAVPFHSIYKGVQAMKAKMNPEEGKAYAQAGMDLKRKNQEWIDANIEGYGEKEEGLAGWMYDIGGGVTTLGAAIGVSVLTKNPAAGAALFGIYQKGDIYGQAKAAGKTPKEAGRLSTVAGGVEGALEYIGLDFMLRKYGTKLAGLAIRTGSEAMQEWSQTVGENLIVKFGGIDAMRKIFEGAGRSAAIGAILGGGVSAVMETFDNSGMTATLEEAGVPKEQIEAKAKEIYTKVEEEAYATVEKESPKAPAKTVEVVKTPVVESVIKEAPIKKPTVVESQPEEIEVVPVKEPVLDDGTPIINLDEPLRDYTKALEQARKIRKAKSLTKQEVKKVQNQFIGILNKSELTKTDKAVFVTKLKNIQTKKQLDSAMDSIKQTMNRLITAEKKRTVSTKIKEELTKTKPVKKGQRKVGKYDYKSNKFFNEVRGYSELTQPKAQAELDNMPTEGLSQLNLIKKRILSLKANGANASLEIHKKVLADIKLLKILGAAAKDDANFDKIVNRMENVDEALAGIDKVKTNIVKKGYAKGFGNIGSMLNFVFGKKFADKYNPEINESRRNTAIYFKTKEVTARAAKIYDEKNILKVFQDMAQEKFDLTDFEGLDYDINRMQLLDIYNSLKNDAVRKRYYDAFGEGQITGLMNKLSAEDMLVADLLQESVQGYRQVLNDRNIEITGQDLGMVENYWPATSEYQPSVYDDYRTQGETPSALKERAKGKVIPRPVDAWHKFGKHIAEAEHVKNLAREHEALKRMFTDRKVKREITKKFGEDVYKTMMDQVEGISLNAQTANIDAVSNLYGKALNNWIKAKLPSLSIFLRQLMSASNYMEVMPVAKWVSGYTKGVLSPKKTFDYMWQNLPFLEARFHKGYKEALSRALDDAQKMSVGQSNWAMGLSALVRAGDISAIIYGGKPYVDYLMSKEGGNFSKERAFEEFEKTTLKAQQSGLTSSLSEFQKNKNAFVRLLLAFKNTPAQYLRKMGDATIAFSNKDISAEQYAKTMTIYGVIQPTLYVMAGAAVREGLKKTGELIRGDDPEDIEWENLWHDIIIQMVINPVTAVPFLSGGAKYFIRKKMGKKAYSITSLPMISDLETALRKITKEEVTFDDWLTIAGTALELSTSAPVLSVKRMYKYLTENDAGGTITL